MSENPPIKNENKSKLQEKGFINQGNIENLTISNSEKLPPKEIQIDWGLICKKVLQQQKNLRKQITERGFELNIYVPLGLVERKQQQRRQQQEDPNREQVCQLEETVITKEYQHDNFLQEIIGGTEQENQHIAITGEPGAGKTTLLYKIATWIEEHQKGLPILISLAALEKQSLEDYLLNNWLKKTEEFIPEEDRQDKTALEEALKKRFREGGVWLLLDGLDEMAANSSGGVLTTIRQYLEGWINKARIVLTSRSNVWDEQKTNPLSDFKTFRTLQFTDEQVTEFIEGWFAVAAGVYPPLPPLNKGGRTKGELDNIVFQLQNQLKEPQYQSIQELIHNPLRLAMLCEVWYHNPGQLPETKAQLYERYIQDYYREWKPEQHQISTEKQDLLNRKLGELALQQLDSEVRFRIPRKRAYEVMEEEYFNLACQVGWLNIVDRETGTDEIVYAFYHPSFQEYFAATVIDDWDYFIPRKHKNKPIEGKKYRIFEAKWKEPFLLWLGRGDVEKNEKEALIKKLVRFKDGCGKWENKGLYDYRAYCLAAMGVREFKQCSRTEEIVKQIVNWLCPSIFEDALYLKNSLLQLTLLILKVYLLKDFLFKRIVLRGIMQAALSETEREKAIDALEALITSEHKSTRDLAARSLGEIAPGNHKAIDALVALLEPSGHKQTHCEALWSLGKIASGNSKALAALVAFIGTSDDYFTRRYALEILGEIALDNSKAIDALVAISQTSHDYSTRSYAVEILGKIAPDNDKVIDALVALLEPSGYEWTRYNVRVALEKIAPDNDKAIARLVALIETSGDEWTRFYAAKILGKMAPGNSKGINALVALIETSKDESTRFYAAWSLRQIAPGNSKAINALVALIETSQDQETRRDAAESLVQIANEIKIAALVALIKTSADQETRRDAAKSLVQIASGNEKANEKAIAALLDLIESEYSSTRLYAVRWCLEKIALGNEKAIAALLDLIKTSQDEKTRLLNAVWCLEKIAPGNKKAIAALEALIETSEDEWTLCNAAESLEKIAPGNKKAIDALEYLIETSEDEETRLKAAQSLGKIAPGNEKAIAALVAILIKIETSLTLNQFYGDLNQFETGFDAVESLTQILTKSEMKKAITNLRKGIPIITWKIWLYFSFYPYIFLIFWHCAQTLPYPEFYQAWHDRRNHWFKPLLIILLSGSVAGTFIYTLSQTYHPPAPRFP